MKENEVSDTLYNRNVDIPSNRGPQKFVYLIIITLGFVLIGMGAYSRWAQNQSWIPELCISVGVAIAAPAILSYLYRKYLMEDIKAELDRPAREFKEEASKKICQVIEEVSKETEDHLQVIKNEFKTILKPYKDEIKLLKSSKDAGLFGLHKSRRDALSDFCQFLENEKDEIIIVGSSLLGLLQDADKEYDKVRKILKKKCEGETKVRFLLTHPMVADLRARQEKRRFKDIGKEIIKSLNILIEEWKVDKGTIKLYEGTPTCFGIKTGNAMLINPYPYGVEAYTSPCIVALREGFFYEHYENAHFRAWNSEIAQPVPEEAEVLTSALEQFEKSIKSLFSLTKKEQSDC